MELMTVADVREFFRDALQHALRHQHVSVREHTEHYVVNLLAMFTRTEALYEPVPGQQPRLKPLAILLAEAVETDDPRLRYRMLQRLGDVALFIAGFLAGHSQRTVDVDYHVAMGGRAYGTLAQVPVRGAQRALASVFAELGDKFEPLVDALAEIGDGSKKGADGDVVRLFELWQRTGSTRARRQLATLGVQPMPAGALPH